MLGMSPKMSNGIPAAFSVRVMTADEACHHLKWSLRSKRLASPSVATRRARKLFLRSNRVQSVGVSPVAESLVSWRSGSRRSPETLSVFTGGARGGASPRGVAAEGCWGDLKGLIAFRGGVPGAGVPGAGDEGEGDSGPTSSGPGEA